MEEGGACRRACWPCCQCAVHLTLHSTIAHPIMSALLITPSFSPGHPAILQALPTALPRRMVLHLHTP